MNMSETDRILTLIDVALHQIKAKNNLTYPELIRFIGLYLARLGNHVLDRQRAADSPER